MKHIVFILLSLICFENKGYCQKIINVSFTALFGGEKLETNQVLNQDNQTITKLKFYITNIHFLGNNNIVWSEKESFHLVDVDIKESMNIALNVPDDISANQIVFNLGVDSLTNASGAMSGDLDPMHGMYWAWQSGYINIKIEGVSEKCPSRKNKYQFHLGGFQFPNSALQEIKLPISKLGNVLINFDLSRLFEDIDLSTIYEIMSPKAQAVTLSEKIASYFEIQE